MSNIFVLDTKRQPLNPVHPGRARVLLSSGQAAVFKRYPFTIILKTAIDQPVVQPLRIKLDPGSKTTGLVLLNDATGAVVFAAACGSFDIRTKQGRVQGISHRFCTPVHHCDGYTYQIGVRYADHPPRPPKKARAIPPLLPKTGASWRGFGDFCQRSPGWCYGDRIVLWFAGHEDFWEIDTCSRLI